MRLARLKNFERPAVPLTTDVPRKIVQTPNTSASSLGDWACTTTVTYHLDPIPTGTRPLAAHYTSVLIFGETARMYRLNTREDLGCGHADVESSQGPDRWGQRVSGPVLFKAGLLKAGFSIQIAERPDKAVRSRSSSSRLRAVIRWMIPVSICCHSAAAITRGIASNGRMRSIGLFSA